MNPIFKQGTVTGTGAALNVSCGFKPDYVKVTNITDGDVIHEWYTDMTAAHAIKTRNVVDNGVTGNSAVALITSNGISQYAGDSSNTPGFTLGTDVSESAKVLAYVAYRNGPGI